MRNASNNTATASFIVTVRAAQKPAGPTGLEPWLLATGIAVAAVAALVAAVVLLNRRKKKQAQGGKRIP